MNTTHIMRSLLLITLCIIAQTASALSEMFYYGVKATAVPTGAGKVYVATQNIEPAASAYADTSYDFSSATELWYDGEPAKTQSDECDVNLWAKPTAGFEFEGWTRSDSGNKILSTDEHYYVDDLIATSTNRDYPTTYLYLARFKVATTIKAGTYFVRNKQTGMYITNGQSLGTQATLDASGMEFVCTEAGEKGVFTMQCPMGYLTTDGRVDAATPVQWTIKHLSNGDFSITSGGVKVGADGVNVVMSADAANDEWNMVAVDEMYDALSQGTYSAPADATCYVMNPGFTSKLGGAWTFEGITNDNLDTEGAKGDFTPEVRGANAALATQTITGLSKGLYRVTLDGFYQNRDTYLEANNLMRELKSIDNSDAMSMLGNKTPNSIAEAQAAFAQGAYRNSIPAMVEADGILTITIRKDKGADSDWCAFDNVRLEYCGDFPQLKSTQSANALAIEIQAEPGVDILNGITATLRVRDDETFEWTDINAQAEVTESDNGYTIAFPGITPEVGVTYAIDIAEGAFSFGGLIPSEPITMLYCKTEQDEPEGISTPRTASSATAIYSVSGMRLSAPTRGINIIKHADNRITKQILK